MASVFTNKGLYLILGGFFRAETGQGCDPTNFYAPLFTSASTPTVDTDTVGDLTQINTGNGYADGGPSVARSSTGFDVWTEDDTNDYSLVQLNDVVYSASGGPIPNGGSGARYMGVSDDGGTVSTRYLYGAFDLVSDRSVSDGQDLTIQNAEFRIGH